MKRFRIAPKKEVLEKLDEAKLLLEKFPSVNSFRNPDREAQTFELADKTHDLILAMRELDGFADFEETEDGEWVRFQDCEKQTPKQPRQKADGHKAKA